jgi:hypothetical protein
MAGEREPLFNFLPGSRYTPRNWFVPSAQAAAASGRISSPARNLRLRGVSVFIDFAQKVFRAIASSGAVSSGRSYVARANLVGALEFKL